VLSSSQVFTSVVDLLGSAIPAVGNTLAAEKTKALDDIERDMLGDGDPNANIVVPSSGVSVSEIRLMAEKLKTTHSGEAPHEHVLPYQTIFPRNHRNNPHPIP